MVEGIEVRGMPGGMPRARDRMPEASVGAGAGPLHHSLFGEWFPSPAFG